MGLIRVHGLVLYNLRVLSPRFEAQPLHGFRALIPQRLAVSLFRAALNRFEAQPLHGFREPSPGSPVVSFSRMALKRKYRTADIWARSESMGLFFIPEGCCPPNLRLNPFTDFKNQTTEVLPYRFSARL
ncbi:hypothetical protein Taro_051614 [Colocasia esculenta]|uniref:Uncharacterized protein n=1 Tax=Colocasia esculenta TaxID=4460 RepID=A0A843XHC9_COLES|nr:hypothetical protein [Colocasia esculenta]